MKILYSFSDIENTTMEGNTTTFICHFDREEQKEIESLEFYIQSLENPQNFEYENLEEKYNDKCIFVEYGTLNNLICSIFEEKNNLNLCRCSTVIPGGYCCSINAEKLNNNNLAAIHVYQYYNI